MNEAPEARARPAAHALESESPTGHPSPAHRSHEGAVVIYGPYRTHASRGHAVGTKPTPWHEEHRRNGSRAPQTPDAGHSKRPGRRFTVKALEEALRAWLTGLGR